MAKTLNDFINDAKKAGKAETGSVSASKNTAQTPKANISDYIAMAKRQNSGNTPAPAANPYAAVVQNRSGAGVAGAESDYLRAADAYKTALAEMNMAAQSGGMVSAELAQRVNQAQAEQERLRQIYSQSKEIAPTQRQGFRDAAQQYRTAMAELQMAGQAGGLVGADVAQRAEEARRQREQSLEDYRAARDQQVAQAPGSNEARNNEGVLSAVLGAADNRESSLPGSEYAKILQKKDFAVLSQPGESKARTFGGDSLYDYINDINGMRRRQDVAQARGMSSEDMGKYSFMTREEIGVYNYLYATEGKKAAREFLKKLEPELDKQWYSGMSRNMTDWLDESDVNKAVASAATVAAQPVRTLTSAAATAEDLLRTAQGKEINPYSGLRTASRLTQDVREGVSQEMGEVGRFAYNTAMSAADSAVGAAMASGIGQMLGLEGEKLAKATNVLASSLMSSEVTSMATAEGKEKGYSDIGALSLGLVRGGIEYASEAIGGEWVIRNMKADPQSFLKTMLRNFIPEGTEEIMSDLGNEGVNALVDWLCGTEESYIGQAYRHFRDEGTPEQKENPWAWTLLTILKQEGLAFLSGGFATVGSTAVQYQNYQRSFRSAAAQLGTDTRTVQQLMNELGTEDPAAVDILAQVSDSRSVEDFRSKMRQLDMAAGAVDSTMQKAGKRGKPESRSTGDLVRTWTERFNDGSVPAPFAGVEDYLLKGDRNGQEGEESVRAASENGDDGVRAVGEDGQPGQIEGAQPGGQSEIRAGVPEGGGENLRSVTLSELGVTNAAEGTTITVQNENSLTGPAAQAAQQVRQLGMEPVAYQGDMIVNGQSVNGYIENGRIFFRTDAKYRDGTAISPDSIVRHEAVHEAKNRDPKIIEAGMELIRQSRTEEQVLSMMDEYRETYQDLYNFEDMSEAEIQKLMEEELVADAYAGLNYFRQGGETVEQVRAAIGSQVESQTAESGNETRGPPRALAAGVNAKTADSQTLAQAEQMETEGRSSEEIRQETGWYRGIDGQWRFEIDDSGATYHRGGDAQFRKDHLEYARYLELTDKMLDGSITDEEFAELRELAPTWGAEQRRLQDMVNRGDVRLNMILDHPALFEAYPELRSASVRFADMEAGERGAYNPSTNTITLSNDMRAAAEDTLVHEIQHAIQAAEGFSGGASTEYWEQNGDGRDAGDRYRNTAGEIEARDAANRRNLTAEERKNTPPDLGDENTVFADGSPVSFESRIDLEDMDIPWDPDNNSSIKDQLTRNLDKINSMDSAVTVTYDKKSGKKYFEQLDDILRTRFGYRIDKQGFGTFLFDKNAIASIRHYVGSDAEAAAAIASPYVLKRGEIISGHRNHNNGRYPSVTFAAPVVLNGQTGVEAVTVLFADKNRVHSLRILAPDGSEFVLMAPNNETELEMAGVDARAPITQPTSSVSNDSIRDSSEKSNTKNQGRASVEVGGEETGKKYTVREGVEKLFDDQLDRLTETADRQGVYYDGVQETLMDALVEAESEEDLDRRLIEKDSARFAYSPELTEKLWELRELIQVNGESQTRTESAQTRTETAQAEFDRLSRELQEEGHEAVWYQERGRRLNELMERGARPSQAAEEGERITAPPAEARNDRAEGRIAAGPEGPRNDGTEEDQGAEDRSGSREPGGSYHTTRTNDTGTYDISVRRKADGSFLARIDRNGKMEEARSFDRFDEAVRYAQDFEEGMTQGRTDAELDMEKSGQAPMPGMAAQLFDHDSRNKEIQRQKKNKAADAATQTLRERIRRSNEELKALRRLEKATGLTAEQQAHKADVQETLDIMNDELTARQNRRGEKKKTEKKQLTGNKPTRSAAEAKNALMDLFHTAAGERAETGRIIEEKLAEIWQKGKLTEEGRQNLYNALMDAGAVPKEAETVYQEIRNSLRGTRIYVSEHDRADFGENWDSLRRRAWGAGIYLTDNVNDKSADVHNQEMAEIFGESRFPTDMAAQDMLENMIDQADRGRTIQQSLSEALTEEARRERVNPDEIFGEMLQSMDETLRTFAEKAGLEVDLKNRSASQMAQERERWEARMERRAQARRESEIRGKLLRGLQRLSRAKGKAGPEIKSQIEEVLRDIDTQARQITPAGLEDLQALSRAYEDAKKKAGYQDDENMGNWIPNPYVEEKLARLTKKHVNDMSLEEVIELGRTVAGLEHAIATQNQMIGEAWDSTIEEEAYGVRSEVESSKGAKPGFFQKWFKEEHLSPRRFLDMLGGWKDGSMKKLSRSLEDGQTRMLDFQRRATQSFDPFLSKKENRQWLEKASGKKAEWTKYTVLDGMNEDGGSYTDIELTPMMKISLYLHSRNMDNLRHIQTGGIVIPNKALYLQGKIQEAYAQGKRVKMNPETVRKIAGELTAQEKTFANHMTTLFDTISKDAINEVSLQLDGFERAGVENYMPIETARQFIKSDVAGEARAQTVEGIGSIANERIHASNPIMLSDASDVLLRQIDKVGRYYGYAIPIRNFQAVNNYVFHQEGNAFETSVKEIMDKKWGAGAEQYITKMLEDLQSGGRRGDMMSSALAKLRGNLAGATLMFNPSVAVSQTASYPGAAQVVGWDGLAAGLAAGRVDTKLIEKYSPLYWYRNQGNSTQELGDYMKDKGLERKLPWIMNWIQKMDSATIRRLWAASEYRVRKDNPNLRPGSRAGIDAGTDAYYKAVAEVFNRAVYDTQPNYTNMERAQILRSESDVTRFLTMYKTVPLQYYGMMVEASGRLQAAREAMKADGSAANQKAMRDAQRYAVNTFGGLLAANTVYVAMKALFKGLRGKDKDYKDDEGNRTMASVSRQLGRDLLETYAGSIIGGAEALSAAESLATGSKFYGPEMSALSYVEDMVSAVQSIVSAAQSEDPRKAAKAVKDAGETLAQGFGIPAKNLETYTIGIIGNLWPEIGAEYQNMFGGLERSDMKSMDEGALATAANLILRNRTGDHMDRAVTDELARLYAAGETVAVPTTTPQTFSYNGVTVQIKDRSAYSDTWGGIVGDSLEELIASGDYQAADDTDKAKLINRLYEYATVQARKGADSEYSAEGNSTYGWTVKADEAVEAGVPLVDTICALTAFSGMTADKDENGNSISGSKKAKVCDYIDGMDITDEQKDVMYFLAGYKENSLQYTPWHGYVEDGAGGGSKSSGKKRSGGRRRRSGGSKAVKVKSLPGTTAARAGARSGAGTPAIRAGSGRSSGADVTESLLDIVNKYYDGDMLAAAFDGGRRARSKIEFEL